MIKCVKCNREADYVSPDSYCKFHWLDWWYDGANLSLLSDKEKISIEEKLVKLIRTDKPEDQDLMEVLYEQYQRSLEENGEKDSE